MARCCSATRAACCSLRKRPVIVWRRRGCLARCVSAWSRRSPAARWLRHSAASPSPLRGGARRCLCPSAPGAQHQGGGVGGGGGGGGGGGEFKKQFGGGAFCLRVRKA